MLLYVDSRFASPYAMSVFVRVGEKELPVDIETIDLSATQITAADLDLAIMLNRVIPHGHPLRIERCP